MKRKLPSLLLLLTIIIQSLTACTQAEPETQTTTVSNTTTKENVKQNSKAQDDFYGYVNQKALQEMEIPFGESSNGTFLQAGKLVEEQLDEIIEQVVTSKKKYQPGSNEQLIRDMYEQCVAYEYETSGAKEQLEQMVNEIESADNLNELVPVLGKLYTEYGCAVLFKPVVRNNAYQSEKNALYAEHFLGVCNQDLEGIYEEEASRTEIKITVQTALYGLGIPYKEAKKRGKDTTYMLLDLAEKTDFSLAHMDNMFEKLTYFSEEEMEDIFLNIDVTLLKESFGVFQNPYGGWYTYDPKQFQCIGTLFKEENLENIKSYAIAELFCTYQSCLSDDLQTQRFKTVEEKAKKCVKIYLERQLGELYAEKYYTEELKTKVTRLCMDIQEACEKKIEAGDWMSKKTKKLLIKKLYNIEFFLGAQEPHVIEEKDQEIIGSNLFQTLLHINSKEITDNLEQIGQPYNPNEFDMSPQTMNACYSQTNRMTIPLAMMQQPMYDENGDYAENLGSLGMVVAHELSHAFDSSCILFDENGNYNPNWISKEEYDIFVKRSEAVVDYYETFYVMDVYPVDGMLTLGENYADLGAMELLVTLVHKKEDYKKLFESYGRTWCELIVSTQAVQMLELDVHSPSNVRVNAVLSSCEEFYEAYGVQEGDGMYREERVSRW
ncbi:MAG: M13 family metallopeptidase [Lachnospiraceae bacterium]|nr:M13 family metallopeptidase [Lachnospiraceae bacterium]